MRKLAITMSLVVIILIAGCTTNKVVENNEVDMIKPDIIRFSIENESILQEVDKVLNYIYLGEAKPIGEYMKHIDKKMDELSNQRYYLDEFFEELRKLQELINDPSINSERFEDEYTGPDDSYIDDGVDWADEEYNSITENSHFILTDEEGRDYIDVNLLEFFNDGIYFSYNNETYMLDLDQFKPNLKTLRLKQHNYRLILAKEDDPGRITAVYRDTKTGQGKTIEVIYSGNTIEFIEIDI